MTQDLSSNMPLGYSVFKRDIVKQGTTDKISESTLKQAKQDRCREKCVVKFICDIKHEFKHLWLFFDSE